MIVLEESDLNDRAYSAVTSVMAESNRSRDAADGAIRGAEVGADLARAAADLKVSKLKSREILIHIIRKTEAAKSIWLRDQNNKKKIEQYGLLLVDQEEAYAVFEKEAEAIYREYKLKGAAGGAVIGAVLGGIASKKKKHKKRSR